MVGFGKHARHGYHTVSHWFVASIIIALVLAITVVSAGAWAYLSSRRSTRMMASGEVAQSAELVRGDAVPDPVPTHHGNSPACPDVDCIAMLINGDLLFHERLWNNFAGPNTSATDGTAFDFDPLFEPMKRYIAASDVSVCNFETPVAKRGGPYSAYPVFNIPPEVVDAAANVGYTACTTATNHSWDQGAQGIARLTGMLDEAGILHTGAYTDEASSMKPMVIDSPTGGGKISVIAGTSSLNGYTADPDWMVDQLRGVESPHHQSDIDRAVAKAQTARSEGADVVAITLHSIVEYVDYADPWQISEAHALADTGAFDLIFGTGSHSAQPIEYYNGTWIIYGLGNAVTVTTSIKGHESNNEGVTMRVQFAGKSGQADSWRVSRIDWLPTASERQGTYTWCPMAEDHPDGVCWSESEDARIHERIRSVLYRNNPDPNVVREWKITQE